MLDAWKRLSGGDADQFGAEIQKLSQRGEFDPFALIAGERTYHSVFIAPFSPFLKESRDRFLADGTGPLASTVEVFQRQGAPAGEAMHLARQVFEAAQGMCIVVMAGDHGLDSIPQLFFGHFDQEWIDQAVRTCGERFSAGEQLKSDLAAVVKRAEQGTSWQFLRAGGGSSDSDHWLGLADRLTAGLDGGIAHAASERLRDLAWWIGSAVLALDKVDPVPVERLPPALRCVALSGDLPRALARLKPAIADLDEEALVVLLDQLATTAIGRGEAGLFGDWLSSHLTAITKAHSRSYELLLIRLKAAAAAGKDPVAIIGAAAELMEANRKSARHDLLREPIWRVSDAEPGDLLETAAVAELLGRSATFVAKRLEQGTIPTVRQADQVRIPRRALEAWKAIMDGHKLLD